VSHVERARLVDFLRLVARWLQPGGRYALIDSLPDPASGASRTLCEYVPGSGRLTDTCQSSRECVAKFACPEGARPGAGFCLPVCDPTHPCSSGGTCKLYGSTYGYCVTT